MSNTLSASFLENLRSATASSHSGLEALPVSVSIMNPSVTNSEYALYLNLMHDVVKDAEESIFPIIYKSITGLDIYPKAQFIEADLKTLGFVKDSFLQPLSQNLDVTAITPAFAFGIMYVIEGSSLGGRVILKNISNALGHNAESGASYFSGYGAQTGSHWKAFLNALTEYESMNNCQDEIIAGANFAFDAINLHFTANSHL
jgi:heme oxygenase